MDKSLLSLFAIQILFHLFFWNSFAHAAESDLPSKLIDMLWIIVPVGIFVAVFVGIDKNTKR